MMVDKETLKAQFKQEWIKNFNYSLIKHEGRIILQQLTRDERFKSLSTNDIAEITYTNKSAIHRLRTGDALVPKTKTNMKINQIRYRCQTQNKTLKRTSKTIKVKQSREADLRY